ncbi:MAG: ATPase, T2SS/T4P/T4SS family [Candidatus Pacearchaeota archaeon]
MEKIKKYSIVVDTSIIIEGILSDLIKNSKLEVNKIIIPEAVISELENQANKGKEIGFVGIEEIENIKKLSGEKNIEVIFYGEKPTEEIIKSAKVGAIDAIIRKIAEINNACLFTADRVQAAIAKIKGVDILFFEVKARKLSIEKFFGDDVMSLHLRENVEIMAKKGKPGNWQLVIVGRKVTREELKKIEKEIIEVARQREDGFIEIDRKYSTIVQIGTYRIVITRPPFSKYYEITIASPIKQLDINDYKLDENLLNRFERAEGILVAGPPGNGKSTFVQALAKFYLNKNKIVKTIEAPRDLVLPKEITQYALAHSTHDEIRDILLLSRPDYTMFDEMRNDADFRLYTDLRLAGIGLVGVVHATEAIDAIQRFFNRVELGTLPSIIDTVIFIKDGEIKKVLSLEMKVKVPYGMRSEDLARPIILVRDYKTKIVEYEIYNFADQIVVNKVKTINEEEIINEIEKIVKLRPEIEINDNNCIVYLPSSRISLLIGKKGRTINNLEKKFGIFIEVREKIEKKEKANYKLNISKKNLKFIFDRDSGYVIFYKNGEEIGIFYFKDGILKIKRKSMLGKKIFECIRNKNLEIYYG